MLAKQLTELLSSRHSIRGYLPQAVTDDVLQQIFSTAQLSASNCNTQPWHSFVISGEKKEQLKKELIQVVTSGNKPNGDFSYFGQFINIQKERQVECAMALYNNMGIERTDKKARMAAMLRNFEFFDAPHVAFICMPKSHEIVNTLDIGIYLQTLMLVMESYGIGSCAQGALGFYPDPIKKMANIPDDLGIVVGLSFGYEDPNHPANKTKTSRANLQQSVQFIG